eukprot:547783-Rhodomonas_salina.1
MSVTDIADKCQLGADTHLLRADYTSACPTDSPGQSLAMCPHAPLSSSRARFRRYAGPDPAGAGSVHMVVA